MRLCIRGVCVCLYVCACACLCVCRPRVSARTEGDARRRIPWSYPQNGGVSGGRSKWRSNVGFS